MSKFFDTARLNMVKNQLIPHYVSDDEVLKSMYSTKRHKFMPESWQEVAYLDRRIPVSENREMLDPNTLARMVQALELKDSDIVLDVGCGLGYSSTIISNLAKRVVAIENDQELVKQCKKNTQRNNKINVEYVKNLTYGYENGGDFNAILVNGIATNPQNLLSLLKKGGRLVCMEIIEGVIWVVYYKKIGNNCAKEELFNANAQAIF